MTTPSIDTVKIILTSLQLRDLLVYRRVCKLWKKEIDDIFATRDFISEDKCYEAYKLLNFKGPIKFMIIHVNRLDYHKMFYGLQKLELHWDHSDLKSEKISNFDHKRFIGAINDISRFTNDIYIYCDVVPNNERLFIKFVNGYLESNLSNLGDFISRDLSKKLINITLRDYIIDDLESLCNLLYKDCLVEIYLADLHLNRDMEKFELNRFLNGNIKHIIYHVPQYNLIVLDYKKVEGVIYYNRLSLTPYYELRQVQTSDESFQLCFDLELPEDPDTFKIEIIYDQIMECDI